MKQTILKTSRSLFLIPICYFFISLTLCAQNFDYNRYPKLDFSIDHMQLRLEITDDENGFEGLVQYQMHANIDSIDTLILNAAHIDIRQVFINESEVDFQLKNDSLIIKLPGKLVSGRQFSLEIGYGSTEPKFGIHYIPGESIRTSLLPLATQHWVPVIDHPRISFTTEIHLKYPSELEAMAPGIRQNKEIISVDHESVAWRSSRKIPASALWFVIGDFTTNQTTVGIKQVSLSVINGQFSRGEQDSLLNQAYDFITRFERSVGFEYPYNQLQIVLMNDHRWEEKPYAAGLVYLYNNSGDLINQLKRGIAAQWFGVFLREEQWARGDGSNVYQAAMQPRATGEQSLLKETDSPRLNISDPYKTFDAERWNNWQKFYDHWESFGIKKIIETGMTDLLTSGINIYNWEDYADFWYRNSGQPQFEVPAFKLPGDTVRIDSLAYEVQYNYNEAESSLILVFTALDSVLTELMTVPLVEYSPGSVDTVDVTFTGSTDSVAITVSPSVMNADIVDQNDSGIRFKQRKPSDFWLYQLRNSQQIEKKVEAASQLGTFSDLPDLQLAIMDILSKETSPELKAALLKSMSNITGGAAGTAQIFLDELESDNRQIRETVIHALRAYNGNAEVQEALSGVIMETRQLDLFELAMESYNQVISDSSDLLQLAEQVIQNDTTGQRAIRIIEKLPSAGFAERAVRQAEFYLEPDYVYTVRRRSLKFLIEYDINSEKWTARAKQIAEDNDPRMRYHLFRNLVKLPADIEETIVRNWLFDEYDGRVYRTLQRYRDGATETD